ncbi:MAG: hypothetical protein RLN78_08015 [Phycisphaerales bacterium]
MKIRSLTFATITILLIAGCGKDPTVNAKGSDEEQKASIESVKDSLPVDRRDDFEEAMKTLLFSDFESLSDLADGEGMVRRLQDQIDGKTGEEIIAEAEKAREQRKQRERDQAITEIEEIVAKLSPETEKILANFVVERSLFIPSGGGYLGSDASINLVVRNDTDHAVSRTYFQAILLTPGRSVPWVDAEFNYDIPGGLEPGESAEWNLRPNMFGEWSKAPDDRDDTVFIVRAIGLDDADGASITGERFTPRDQERLASLMGSIEFEGESRIQSSIDARSEMLDRWREAAMRRSALIELALLRDRKAQADAARSSLVQFEVTRSRFYWNEDRFSRDPVIDLTVHNGTGETVTRFRAQGVLSSPGRETPWVEDSFSYAIRGGMEHGETEQFKLSPNMFGSWASAPRDRTDMVLTVSILSIEDSDGEDLFEVEWEPEDDARFAALEQMVAAQRWE